ncbi:MAG: PocR ligand-binding domain-containing protein, partial [Desulfobacterales bacterium]
MLCKALIISQDADIHWGHFEKSLYDRFQVNAVTLKKNGLRKTSGDVRWANELCALIKANPNGASRICDRMLRILIHETLLKKSSTSDECAAGMNKIVFPIVQNDELEGFINICGRPFINTERIYIDYIEKTLGVKAEKIRQLLSSLRP